MTLTSRVSIVVAAVLLSSPIPAFPQTTESAPSSGGLFGGTDNRNGRHKLDCSFSLVEAYDSDTTLKLAGASVSNAELGGPSTMFVGNIRYQWRRSRVEAGVTGESVLRNHARFDGAGGVSYATGAGLSARLDRRTTLFVNQTAAYSPSYLYLLFPDDKIQSPGDANPAAPDYTITHTDSYLYGTTLTVTRGLTTRSKLTAIGELQYTQFPRDSARDQNYQGIRGEYARSLSKHASLSAGYRYRTGNFWQATDVAPTQPRMSATEHTVDFGAAYSRPLSATRKVSLAFSMGSSVMTAPVSPLATTQAERFVQLTAAASGDYEFTTQWKARGSYRRGLEYVAPLGGPVFADGFTAELTGLAHAQVEVFAATRYSSGASALHQSSLTYDTYGTEFRVRYALARFWAIYGQYLYYFYDFQRNTLRDIPSGLERHGVSVGLTLWAPALRR